MNGVDNHDDSSDYGHGSNDPVAMPQAGLIKFCSSGKERRDV